MCISQGNCARRCSHSSNSEAKETRRPLGSVLGPHYAWDGTHRFLCYLSLLLNSLLSHNFVPQSMLLSTILPIPKKKSKIMNDSDNYRGIALSCVVGKLLDKVILRKCQDLQDTSQQQLGFKKAHSTMQCTFIVNTLAAKSGDLRFSVPNRSLPSLMFYLMPCWHIFLRSTWIRRWCGLAVPIPIEE